MYPIGIELRQATRRTRKIKRVAGQVLKTLQNIVALIHRLWHKLEGFGKFIFKSDFVYLQGKGLGAVAGGQWPSPRFPSPLIEPAWPLAMVRIAVAVAIVGVAVLGDGLYGFAVKNLRAVRILNRQLTY
jgi:hypothetical protein